MSDAMVKRGGWATKKGEMGGSRARGERERKRGTNVGVRETSENGLDEGSLDSVEGAQSAADRRL